MHRSQHCKHEKIILWLSCRLYLLNQFFKLKKMLNLDCKISRESLLYLIWKCVDVTHYYLVISQLNWIILNFGIKKCDNFEIKQSKHDLYTLFTRVKTNFILITVDIIIIYVLWRYSHSIFFKLKWKFRLKINYLKKSIIESS